MCGTKLVSDRKHANGVLSKCLATDIIISTPLRLVSSLQSGNLELEKYVSASSILPKTDWCISVRHLILDEADRMLDAEFLSQVQEVVSSCTHENVQKAVFSATLPANAEKVAMDMLRNPIRVVVGLKCVPARPCARRVYAHIHIFVNLETRLCHSLHSPSHMWPMTLQNCRRSSLT